MAVARMAIRRRAQALSGCCGCRTSSRSSYGCIPGLKRSIEKPQSAYAERISKAPCTFLHAVTSLQA